MTGTASSTTWKRTPIGKIIRGLYDGPHATPKPASQGPVFLGIKNITDDGRLDLSEIRHISEEDFPRWTRRILPQPGDIVITYEATLNRYAIIPEGFRGCLGRRLALIRPDSDKVDTRFLFYYFFGADWRRTISQNLLSGSTVDRVPLTRFPDFEISLPPLPSQRKIAFMLSAYDDLIENNTRRIEILEEMAQAIYREWFVNFRFPGHEKAEMVDSELGSIPEGWKVKNLQEVCTRITDGSHWSPKTVDDGYPMASVKDMHTWGFHTDQCRKIAREDYAELVRNDCKPLRGDVLVAKDGSYLKHIFVVDDEQELVILSSIALLRPSGRILPHMLSFYLKDPSVKSRMAGYVSGVAIPRIVLKDFRTFPVLAPPLDTQHRFMSLVRPMIRECQLLIKKNANLRDTRDMLLPKLISGEVDVREVDNF
jgi:type I restriction enzyme, S subunit